ncbi:DNA recombination protein RmuC [bacterium]|nr:DNA recombination protein RmuC [bacterium]NBX98630.1 DNA recombination protein RmuC [bacterium]NDC94234.1 DNA recombination protein RmuC [bacterium]NDD84001.1 DNA recombination protein RmuC [bacterium]NDG29445.1 DNA recombination protein RmuC [bacterium]
MQIVIIVLLVLNVAILLYFLRAKKPVEDNQSQLMLKADIAAMSAQVEKLQEKLSGQLDIKLDKNQESMSKQLAASAKLVSDVTERLTKLDETNKRVVDVADELKSLQNVLQNPKQRGVLGEFYLEQILQNLLPAGSYELQYKLADGTIVDAVIKLDGKLLPIDSKFSLENYNRIIEAQNEDKPALEKAFKEDLKRRIDETAKYIQPKKGTLDQALMFIPSEAIYYDLLANKVGLGGVSGRDLMQYAAVDKRVTIVGPSTLSAMLQVIVQGLRSLEIQKDTEVIRKNVEQLTKHLGAYDVYFKKVGTSLGATVGHYNSAYKELGKIDKDIVKIAGGETSVNVTLLDKPHIED